MINMNLLIRLAPLATVVLCCISPCLPIQSPVIFLSFPGFADLFDLDHFIESLKSEGHIVRELPDKFDKNMIRKLHSMILVSWSSMGYYKKVLGPFLKQHKVRTECGLFLNNVLKHVITICHVMLYIVE